ncbi:MAG: alkene reductase [Longimicrobiales bacterium]|nr:alkene reductase [Longimicrobiales bacterium]
MNESDPASSPLFTPFSLGRLRLPNRAVMAPMTRSRAPGNRPNDLMAEYYRQRAGAGLIVTEGTSPSPNGLGYPRIPGLFDRDQVAGWRGVADAVHAAGGRIFVQLMHTGRVTHPANLPAGATALAPSPVPLESTRMWVDGEGLLEIPAARAMTPVEVEATLEEFTAGARLAVDAGFDGVELHGANGYLIEQFLHPHTNRRDDDWGGSLEARAGFCLEAARRAAAAIGPERVGIRLSPFGTFNEMPADPEADALYRYLARELNALDLAYLHVIDPGPMGGPTLPADLLPAMREVFSGAFILAGGYDLERAQRDLRAGRGDLVAFGRPFLANPDLVERLRAGAALNEPRPDLFYSGGAEGYTDYPALGAGAGAG